MLFILAMLFLLDHVVAIRWSNIDVPKTNVSVEAANGTSSHGSSRTLCYPLTWTSLASFYLVNFGAHIATVQSTPGDKWPLMVFNMVLALFFPTSGLMRGLNSIARNFSSSFFARKIVARILCIKKWRRDETSLERACKAGALCVVVRNANWRPRQEQIDIHVVLREMKQNTEPRQPRSIEMRDTADGNPYTLSPKGDTQSLGEISLVN